MNNQLDDKELREQLEDRIYLALQKMHESKHLKKGCFCTTEICGAFKFQLEAIDAYTSQLISNQSKKGKI